jgi:hypothetical protein
MPCTSRSTPGKENWYPLYRSLDGPPGPVWTGVENPARTTQPIASCYPGPLLVAMYMYLQDARNTQPIASCYPGPLLVAMYMYLQVARNTQPIASCYTGPLLVAMYMSLQDARTTQPTASCYPGPLLVAMYMSLHYLDFCHNTLTFSLSSYLQPYPYKLQINLQEN